VASQLVNPLLYPQEWDVVRVSGSPGMSSPGVCKLSGWARKNEFDVKKGKGTKGSTLTFTGLPPVEGEIEFFLWDDGTLGTGHNHFEEWSRFKELLKYDPTKKTIEAIAIFHPALDDIGVFSVICVEIGILIPTRELLYTVKCKFIEYTPQPKASAVGTARGTKKITPTDAAAAHAQAAGDASTQALKEALDGPTSQENEMNKLWKDYNAQGTDGAS